MNAAELEFAPASVADAAAVAALVNSAYRGAASRCGWTTEADLLGGQRTDRAAIEALVGGPNGTLLLARRRGELVGCVLLERKDDGAYLGMLTVRPDLQAAGVGRRLLAAGEAHASEAFGARWVEMTVIEQRRELVAWYERRGYVRTGERRPFPYGDERFGLPQRPDLVFVVLRREVARG